LAATYTNDNKLQWVKLDGQTADGIAAVTEAAAQSASMNPRPAYGMAAMTQSAAQSVSMKLLPRQELHVAHMNDVDEHEDQTEAGTSGQAADDDNSSSAAAAVLVGGVIACGLAVCLTPPRHRAIVAAGAVAVLALGAAPARPETGSRPETCPEPRAVLKPKPLAGLAPRTPFAGTSLIFVLMMLVSVAIYCVYSLSKVLAIFYWLVFLVSLCVIDFALEQRTFAMIFTFA